MDHQPVGSSRSRWRGLLAACALASTLVSASGQTIHAAVRFAATDDWGSGANAWLYLTNTGTVGITNWTLEFDFDRSLSPYSHAAVLSHVGQHYVLTNLSYSAQIPANGGTLIFQSGVTPGSLNGDQPTNYFLNGVSLSAGPGPLPTLTVADVSVIEGNTGVTPMTFLVLLSSAATNPVAVNYATLAATATAGSDFIATNGTLIFAPGATQRTVTVSILADRVPEPDETFTLTLSNPTNATLARASATGTILDDDRIPVTTYPDWRATNAIPSSTGDLQDADGDGINTLWEYVLNLNPTLPDAWASPMTRGVENGALQLTYPKYRPDIVYRSQTCDDLRSWTTNGVTETANGHLVTARVPISSAAPARFLGLRVSFQPRIARFLQLYAGLHDPANGYFSSQGIPYHSAETLLCEAPDYGHETTSEAYSYYLWLEAMYGRLTGDWRPLALAWTNMEQYIIPTHADQPSNDSMNPAKPATYAPEWELPSLYPAQLNPSASVGADPLYSELKTAYGTSDLYGMHWLLDVDNWYGFGSRGDGITRPSYINTFQRGKQESVWETVPQPSWDAFNWGGPNGFLDLFTGDSSYARQSRYTDAPDADARAIQALYWAKTWADAQGGSSIVNSLVPKASRMGDCLRYAFFDKYFRNVTNNTAAGTGRQAAHYLLGWYYAWGGSVGSGGGWAWRIGCGHAHFGYQNPLAAWALGNVAGFIPASPAAQQDWTNSLRRQLEFYRWLQSSEGAIAGGATTSWNGRYETPPSGTPTFYGMAYQPHPVYEDPPSNQWFGMQAWSMERVAEYYFLTNDPLARQILDQWVAWALSVLRLPGDGSFAIPTDLSWTGQPDTWNPAAPGTNATLHVTVTSWGQDAGITASLARGLSFYSAAAARWNGTPHAASKEAARNLLDRLWTLGRDGKGVSIPETRADYRRFFEQSVYAPPGWTGHMPNGDLITNGVTFLGLRSKYQQDPAYPALLAAYSAWVAGGRQGEFLSPSYRYHRFWAQAEIALANAQFDLLFPDE